MQCVGFTIIFTRACHRTRIIQPTLHKNPEEWRTHLHQGGHLKSHKDNKVHILKPCLISIEYYPLTYTLVLPSDLVASNQISVCPFYITYDTFLVNLFLLSQFTLIVQCWRAEIMELLLVQFPSSSCCFLSLRYKHSPLHPVLSLDLYSSLHKGD